MRHLPLALLALTACNTPPDPLPVSISPTDPTTTDDLVATIDAPEFDADGDPVTVKYFWYRDGTDVEHLRDLTVPASETAKHQEWKLFVQPADGTVMGPPTEAVVTIANTPPSVELTLTPEVPLTTEDVTAELVGTDPDDDEITTTYAWTLDGAATSYQDATLPADATTRGDVWTLSVTPNDGEEDGEPVEATVNIDNTAPEMLSVTLSPTDPREGDEILATIQGQDDDGDHITYRYAWIVDGKQVIDDEIDAITGEWFDKHQQVSVTVTPHDGFVTGVSMSAEAVTVLNTVPSIEAVALDPTDIYEATEVTCTPSGWVDDDGDAEGYSYLWEVNGVEVGKEATLTGEHFDKGDMLACAATPTDGDESGETLSSDDLEVLNTPPAITAATLSTSSPMEGDTLTVSVEASDDDGDEVSLAYAWHVDGLPISTNESIDSTLFDKHQSIYVVITPDDGTEDGADFTTATATAANTPPEITTLELSPSDLHTDDTLATSVTTTDADGDAVTLSYAWTVDGSAVSETGSSLDGETWFDKHQTVVLVVTPNDGEDDGGTATDSVDVLNTPPGAPELEFSPEEPQEDEWDDVTCTIAADSVDADGDPVTYTFSWLMDGIEYVSAMADTGSALMGPSTTTHTDDTVPAEDAYLFDDLTCVVTPNDGEDDGADAEATVSVINSNLVAYWDFDEGSGTTAYDSSPHGNDGTIHSAIYATGVSGTALQFAGTGSTYVDVPDDSSLRIETGDYTICAWVYLDAYATEDRSTIIESRDAYEAGLSLNIGGAAGEHNQAAQLNHWTVGSTRLDGAATIPLATWTHITATYDYAAEQAQLYIDGVLDTSGWVGPITTASSGFDIGRESYGTSTGFDGRIDELRIYSYVRSAEQIANDHARHAP